MVYIGGSQPYGTYGIQLTGIRNRSRQYHTWNRQLQTIQPINLEQIALQVLQQQQEEQEEQRRNCLMRPMVTNGRAQAAEAIYRDYLHPETPRFDNKTFQQIFHVATWLTLLLSICFNDLGLVRKQFFNLSLAIVVDVVGA
jgi:hypothetical protein